MNTVAKNSEVFVPVHDNPSLREVSDRAKMAWLGMLMEEEKSHVPSVAKRLGCTDANVRKAINYLVNKYGDDSRGQGEGSAAQEGSGSE